MSKNVHSDKSGICQILAGLSTVLNRSLLNRSLVRAGSVIAQRQTHIQKGKDCDKTSLKAANDPGSGARRAHE